MFFDKIRVSFFKRIAGTVELNFKPGINIISGDNNSGKSSLCEALTLATTGFVSGTLESKVSRESGEKKFLIDLLFSHGSPYSLSIKAGIERTEKVLSNLDDETEIYETPSSVSYHMEQMIDPALTLYGSIALQHKTTSVIFDDPAPRLQKLKTILGLETLGKAVELIKKEQSEVKEKSVGLKSSLKTLESLTFDLKDEPDYSGDEEIETKYLASQEAYTDYLKSRESYAKAVASIDAERREYELLCQRYESALKEKLSIENTISAIQKDLDEITITSAEPLDPLIELRDSFKDEGTNLKRDIEDCVADLKRVEEGKCPTCGKPYDNLDPASLLQRKAELEAQKNKVVIGNAELWHGDCREVLPRGAAVAAAL
jgi:DNA repair exonuclease SbcCD ATPase subunit